MINYRSETAGCRMIYNFRLLQILVWPKTTKICVHCIRSRILFFPFVRRDDLGLSVHHLLSQQDSNAFCHRLRHRRRRHHRLLRHRHCRLLRTNPRTAMYNRQRRNSNDWRQRERTWGPMELLRPWVRSRTPCHRVRTCCIQRCNRKLPDNSQPRLPGGYPLIAIPRSFTLNGTSLTRVQLLCQ